MPRCIQRLKELRRHAVIGIRLRQQKAADRMRHRLDRPARIFRRPAIAVAQQIAKSERLVLELCVVVESCPFLQLLLFGECGLPATEGVFDDLPCLFYPGANEQVCLLVHAYLHHVTV